MHKFHGLHAADVIISGSTRNQQQKQRPAEPNDKCLAALRSTLPWSKAFKCQVFAKAPPEICPPSCCPHPSEAEIMGLYPDCWLLTALTNSLSAMLLSSAHVACAHRCSCCTCAFAVVVAVTAAHRTFMTYSIKFQLSLHSFYANILQFST